MQQENIELNTALVKVRPQADEAVIALHEQSLKLLEDATALIIIDSDSAKSATNDLSIISGLKKSIEEKRKEYTQPINEHLKAVNEAFKVFTEPLNQADKITRDKVLEYHQEQERIRQEQEEINRKRLEAAEAEMRLKGELSESVNLVEVTAIRTDMGMAGIATIWKFRVENFALLPDRFKIENASLIGKVVRAGEREIPGVLIWSEDSLRVTAK